MAISNELRKLVDPNNECCCEHCLSNKCKEWAYKVAKFPIKLETSPTDEYGEEYSIGSWFLCGIEGSHPKTNKTISRDTLVHYGQNEPEAIFKACEWILKETNNATN